MHAGRVISGLLQKGLAWRAVLPDATPLKHVAQALPCEHRHDRHGSADTRTAWSQALYGGAGLPDVERLTRKLERRRASLADLCQLYRASSRLPLIEAALRDHASPHAPLLVSR